MAGTWLDKTTLSVTAPGWSGGCSFADPVAEEMWTELPRELQEIALAELNAGNFARNILRNLNGGFIVLTFAGRPRTPVPEHNSIHVHRNFELSNYCYDGTFCTYEHLQTGSFLAFDDPEYDYEV